TAAGAGHGRDEHREGRADGDDDPRRPGPCRIRLDDRVHEPRVVERRARDGDGGDAGEGTHQSRGALPPALRRTVPPPTTAPPSWNNGGWQGATSGGRSGGR